MKKTYCTTDPARRSANANYKKKHQLRASRRLLISAMQKSREADSKKVMRPTRCKTRTVELLSSSPQIVVGEERSKLLFMMALGLLPSVDSQNQAGPVLCLDRLNPILEAQIIATTKEKLKSVQVHNTARQRRTKFTINSFTISSYQPKPLTKLCPCPNDNNNNADNVEVVDLASDDECSIIEVQDTDSPLDKCRTRDDDDDTVTNFHRLTHLQSHSRDPRIRSDNNNNNNNNLGNQGMRTSPRLALKIPAFANKQTRTMKSGTNNNDKIASLYCKILKALHSTNPSIITNKETLSLPPRRQQQQQQQSRLTIPITNNSQNNNSVTSSQIVKRFTGVSCRAHVIGAQRQFNAAAVAKTGNIPSLTVPAPEDIITLD